MEITGRQSGQTCARAGRAIQRSRDLFRIAECESGCGKKTDARVSHAWRKHRDCAAALADAEVMDRIAGLHIPQMVAAAPYLYVAAKSGTQPVILAGTDFGQVAKMNSWWKVEGSWITPGANDDRAQCLVGHDAARH